MIGSAVGQLKTNMEKYDTTNKTVVFTSSVTEIFQTINLETKEVVLIKQPSLQFPPAPVIENYFKEFQYGKLLHNRFPESFVKFHKLLETENSVAIIQRPEGVSLENWLSKNGSFEFKAFLELAIGLTDTVVKLHSMNCIHRDIKPSNFVFEEGKKPKLIDFGTTVMVSKKSPSVTVSHPTGTFLYMSPEQTGRISKSIDFRSDIYSLGISFYQLLSNKVPFEGDKMSLVHSHITKKIPLLSNVPKQMNDILAKMCAKNPNERYSTALGLQKDLIYCLDNISKIDDLSFPCGANDVEQFQIPNKLYGREDVLFMLRSYIKSIDSKMCCISGYSGCGKTKLIEELTKDPKSNLLLAFGKYDQFDRSTPYSAFIKICKSILLQIAGDDEEYKSNITEIMRLYMINDFGGVMSNLLPEIEIFIGEQKEPQPLPRTEEVQKRLFNTFNTFFNCFTDQKQLILVIDDLQWADAASLQLLEKLLSLEESKIFLIGAFRDNEVDQSHPLMQIIDQYPTIKRIHLEPLKLDYLNEMISETLMLPEKEIFELGELIHKKTMGNPLFSREFLITLYEENLIHLDNDKWIWDLERIQDLNFSSNVIDFMIQNLKKESKEMQKVLSLASCLGNTFSINQLSLIWNDEKDLMTTLLEPTQKGWIIQLSSHEYQFYHDRLQQSSYELCSEEELKNSHFIIGTALLKKFKSNQAKENLFKTVKHLNIARSLVQDKNELLQLNVRAAEQCLANSAVKEAHEYSSIAISLLEKDHWKNNYDNSFLAYSVHANTCYRISDVKNSEIYFQFLLDNSNNRVHTLKTYANFMKMASLTIQYDKGVYLLLETFKMFDITKDLQFILLDIQKLMGWIFGIKKKISDQIEQLGGINRLDEELPKCEDEEIILFHNVLAEVSDSLYISKKSNPFLTASCPLISLLLILNHGLTDYSPEAFAMSGFYFSCFFKDPNGYELSQFTEKLVQKSKGNPVYNVALVEFAVGLTSQFGGTIREFRYHTEEAIKYSLSNAEYVFVNYAMNNYGVSHALNGYFLPTIIQKMKNYQNWIVKLGNDFGHDILETQIHFMQDIAGIKSYSPECRLKEIGNSMSISTFLIYEGILKYLTFEYESALEKFETMEPRAKENLGLPLYYERFFYHCLTLIHLYESTGNELFKEKLSPLMDEFKSFSALGIRTFEPRYQLLSLALETVSDKMDYFDTINQFEECITVLQKNSMIIPSAVASMLLLEYTTKKKSSPSISQMYYDSVISLWEGIQAKGMIIHLKTKYPSYSVKRSSSRSKLSNTTTMNATATEPLAYISSDTSLDMMSIVKASQALSVELTLSTLITQVMKIILENVGAERGILLMFEKNELQIKAIADTTNVTLLNQNINSMKDILYYTLIDIVKATKKEIILENALTSLYSQNSYVIKNKSKSIFVHPILKGSNLIGIIYLENNSIEGTFNVNRKIVLGHISSQLAISYENATLYEEVQILNKSYERFLPKEFLNQLGKGDVTKIKKGDATTKKMSVMFSDIRSFTNLTEKMNSEESFSFVNDILSYLAPIISKHNGFIDKFLGDCIMALFPYEVDDSIKCGLEMIKALDEFNKTQRTGLMPVKMGIGINYGDVMIGTLGAEERLDGTVISDAVNTASRVESLTKRLGATFVVTQNVVDNLKNVYSNRCIGKFLLKGKDIPMTLYHMIDTNSNQDINSFEVGLMEFSSQNFSRAKSIFTKINDDTSNYLSQVCDIYNGYTFPDEWNGEIKIDKDGNPEKSENQTILQRKVEEFSKEKIENLSFDKLTLEKKREILSLLSSKYSNEKEVEQFFN